MIIENTKPNVAIFMDIDGVLERNHFSIPEMFSRYKLIDVMNPSHNRDCKHCISCYTAQAHLFESEAVNSLHGLINKIKDLANVHIVISSALRKNRTVPELKQIFHMHEFSNYIIDKTVDNGVPFHEWENDCIYFHREEDKECRASQINTWMKQHPEYSGFAVIDDFDDHLGLNFGDKFISTKHQQNEILTPEDAEKAYKVVMNQLASNSNL